MTSPWMLLIDALNNVRIDTHLLDDAQITLVLEANELLIEQADKIDELNDAIEELKEEIKCLEKNNQK